MELFSLATRMLLNDDVLAIIFFGSRVIGKYRDDSDVDVIVVVRKGGKKDFSRERISFLKETGVVLDTTVMDETEFEDNLTLGTVMMGVSIAYCITYDKINAFRKLEEFAGEVRKYNAVLILPYGRFIVGRTIRKCISRGSLRGSDSGHYDKQVT
ncbi:nucleotidyltransferase domain-containing protein [Stygiolobus caldivivus]